MLADAYASEDVVGFLTGHGAVGYCDLQPFRSVAGRDVTQHPLLAGGIRGCSQAFRLLGGKPAGSHHLVRLLVHPIKTPP